MSAAILDASRNANLKNRRAPRSDRGALLERVTQPLEDNLQAELQVERFSGTDAGCAVKVADGVGGHAQAARRTADSITLEE